MSLTTSPPQEPLITLKITDYLTLACRGIEEVAWIEKSLALQIILKDPKEEFTRVEKFSETLYALYPIKVWLSSEKKRQYSQQESERYRQESFKVTELAEKRLKDMQRKRDILAETIADVKILYPNVADKLSRNTTMSWNQKEKYLEAKVFEGLLGINLKAKEKFKISDELVIEFKSLPDDDDFKNIYVTLPNSMIGL